MNLAKKEIIPRFTADCHPYITHWHSPIDHPLAATHKLPTGCSRALKGVQVVVCGLRCIDLNNDSLKILGNFFSQKEKLKEEKIFIRL